MGFLDRLFGRKVERTRWMKTSELTPGPIQHPRLTPEQIARITRIHERLEPVDGLTLAKRIDLFQRDVDPDAELKIAERIVDVCERAYLEFSPLSHQQRREIYGLATFGSMAPAAEILARYPPKTITASQAQHVLALMQEAMMKDGAT